MFLHNNRQKGASGSILINGYLSWASIAKRYYRKVTEVN